VYMVERAVNPTLVHSCLDAWRGREAQGVLTHIAVMRASSRPAGDPRLWLKSNPSYIPLDALPSKNYLSVPNTDKGRVVLRLTAR